jgi:hypothetical protein
MKESRIESDLTRSVRGVGGLCIKLPANLYKGIPDRLLLLPMGRVRLVETKTRKGRDTLAQPSFHVFLSRIGFPVFIVRGLDGLKEFLANENIPYLKPRR